MGNRIYIILFSLFILVGLASCGPKYVFFETESIDSGTWTYSDTIEFNFFIDDTTRAYDLFLSINHDQSFSNQNIYSRIYTVFPDGSSAVDTISLELTDNFGSWLGRCNSNDCNLDLYLKPDTRFQFTGDYQIRLEQYTRLDSLTGINSLGFKIAEAPKPIAE